MLRDLFYQGFENMCCSNHGDGQTILFESIARPRWRNFSHCVGSGCLLKHLMYLPRLTLREVLSRDCSVRVH